MLLENGTREAVKTLLAELAEVTEGIKGLWTWIDENEVDSMLWDYY